MMPNFRIIFFFICLVIKRFKKIFMSWLAVNYILVYRTIIILNALDKMANCMKLKIVKDWLIELKVNQPIVFKSYLCSF